MFDYEENIDGVLNNDQQGYSVSEPIMNVFSYCNEWLRNNDPLSFPPFVLPVAYARDHLEDATITAGVATGGAIGATVAGPLGGFVGAIAGGAAAAAGYDATKNDNNKEKK